MIEYQEYARDSKARKRIAYKKRYLQYTLKKPDGFCRYITRCNAIKLLQHTRVYYSIFR